jgi:hypothetical protein
MRCGRSEKLATELQLVPRVMNARSYRLTSISTYIFTAFSFKHMDNFTFLKEFCLLGYKAV